MSRLQKTVNANRDVFHAKKDAQSKYEAKSNDDDEEDENALVFLPDLISALENLGGRLTTKEIAMLVKGIKEDPEGGIPHADVVGVLIFASFFISTFDRSGLGYIKENELEKILTAQKQYSSEINDNEINRERNEDENCNLTGPNLGTEAIVDYSKLIETIENRR